MLPRYRICGRQPKPGEHSRLQVVRRSFQCIAEGVEGRVSHLGGDEPDYGPVPLAEVHAQARGRRVFWPHRLEPGVLALRHAIFCTRSDAIVFAGGEPCGQRF